MTHSQLFNPNFGNIQLGVVEIVLPSPSKYSGSEHELSYNWLNPKATKTMLTIPKGQYYYQGYKIEVLPNCFIHVYTNPKVMHGNRLKSF